MLPNFKYEKQVWKKGFKVVAGADEVGRGAWAGSVVAAAVAFAPNYKLQIINSKLGIRINDSKLLNSKQKQKAGKWVKQNSLAWGIGKASVGTINRFGLGKATQIAFRRALKMLNYKLQIINGQKVDFLLIDAFYLPYTRGLRRKNQLAIVKGDQKSVSIASASIIAKVYRDKLMARLAKKHKLYGWQQNKGYGTKEHILAIEKYGITRLHRKKFIRNVVNDQLL